MVVKHKVKLKCSKKFTIKQKENLLKQYYCPFLYIYISFLFVFGGPMLHGMRDFSSSIRD